MPGNWSTSTPRKHRLPPGWKAIRSRVLLRDAYRCTAISEDGVRCAALATAVDHIERGDNHQLENLRSICAWHHGRKSSAEGWAARRPSLTKLRAPEKHPGGLA